MEAEQRMMQKKGYFIFSRIRFSFHSVMRCWFWNNHTYISSQHSADLWHLQALQLSHDTQMLTPGAVPSWQNTVGFILQQVPLAKSKETKVISRLINSLHVCFANSLFRWSDQSHPS